MNIVVLTSSRADYGIYLPLLKKLEADDFFSLKIIAFGTHLSDKYGKTINAIVKDGFEIAEQIPFLSDGDSEKDISNAIGATINAFSKIWEKLQNKVDLVFALGDRYEMFAAVAASVPFNLKIAHLHGGETTFGAIDEKFRHSITQMSFLHFASTKQYAKRIEAMIGTDENVYNVGALSLDNLEDFELLDVKEFKAKFNIDLSKPTILSTIHPETVNLESNKNLANEVASAFEMLSNTFQILVTLPNADTSSTILRDEFLQLSTKNENVICVENLGSLGYFSCMNLCSFLLGNTSSGIIEAASFGKFVINLGLRQKGRACSENIIHIENVNELDILKAVENIENKEFEKGSNIYKSDNKTSDSIIKVLKD